jgi:hypothetical protein
MCKTMKLTFMVPTYINLPLNTEERTFVRRKNIICRGNVGKVATQSKVATYHFFKTTTAIFRHNHRISVTCTTVKLATN